jgi:AAA domain-containing protein
MADEKVIPLDDVFEHPEKFGCEVIDDPPAVGSSTTSAGESTSPDSTLSVERLRSLGVLSPDEVDRICAENQRTQFLIEDFLPAKSIAIAAGESTIGKSPLLCQLGLCVAAGIPFLGLSTGRGRVLHFDLENSLPDCKAMRDSLAQFVGLKFVPPDFLLSQEPRDLEPVIAVVRPRLIIIDSLRAFRPDVAKDNAAAGAWLQEIRKLARTYDCTFLIVHHMRKPNKEYVPPELDSCNVATWLLEMEGARALVNQTDIRIGIAEAHIDPAALEFKWSRRVQGDSPLRLLERVRDEEGEPVGYRQLTGIAFLNDDRRAAFEKLPIEFSTGQAKATLDRGDDPTNKFLLECKELGLIEKLRRGQWKKLPQGAQTARS